MTEKEMEDLLWKWPERLLNEPLKQFGRQFRTEIARPDLIFEDQFGGLVVIEVKKGTLERAVIGQILDEFGGVKRKYEGRPVHMMVVANVIPPERRLALEQYHIECKEIPEFRFRDGAREVGYEFMSESSAAVSTALRGGTRRQSRQDLSGSATTADERESEFRAEGFGETCDVVHALFSILKEIDSQLEPFFEKSSDGKYRYAMLAHQGEKLYSQSATANAHPVRFSLNQGRRIGSGNVKISATAPHRQQWLERFAKAGFNTRQRERSDEGRTRLNEVTLGLVKANRVLLREFFESVLRNVPRIIRR